MRVLDERLLSATDLGNKTLGLAQLKHLGFAVPEAFVIPADRPVDQPAVWAAVERWTAGALDLFGAASLAVRSSSIFEDTATASGAGRFSSVIGVFNPSDLVQAIKEVRESGSPEAVPVIVQVTVDSQFSGVAFSCDPVSFDRQRYFASWTRGLAGEMVSGRQDGALLVARSADDYDGQWPHEPGTLRELISALDLLEAAAKGPVDIEWAIDRDGKLWLLQLRPVVLPGIQFVDARPGRSLSDLPGIVAGHAKMRLRTAAAQAGVRMSNAAVLTASDTNSLTALPNWLPSKDASGLSVVLLHPCRADNRVQREFAQVSDTDVPFFVLGCRRYAIRRYPPTETAVEVARDVMGRGLAQSWVASVVVQEIYDAAATGIVRRIGDDYVAEVAVGHFVPKGVVDVSRFIIDSSGKVLDSFRVTQDVAYRFINGHVVVERPVEAQLELTDDEIARGVLQVTPLFDTYPDAALEFGIMATADGGIQGYLIDFAEGDSEAAAGALGQDLIRDGVVSPGRATGRALRIQNSSEYELERHLHDDLAALGETIADTIFVADWASVDLLPLVSKCGPNTAFVFRHASLLAHLCVVLRERGVPAICLQDDDLFARLTSGAELIVEASDAGRAGPRVVAANLALAQPSVDRQEALARH